MATKISSVLIHTARYIDSLTGNRLSENDTLRKIYYKILSLSGHYSDDNRDFQYEIFDFNDYQLLLDTDELHQKGVAEGNINYELNSFDNMISDGDIVYDLGANIGVFSIFAAAKNPNCEIYSFEPEQATFEHLKKNVELNSFSERVNCLQMIVGDSQGIKELHISSSENQATHSMAQTTHHGNETVKVDMTTVDTFSKTHPAPDVMKIDVEGAEMLVLEGMERSLQGDIEILIDVHDSELRKMGGDQKEVFEILSEYGTIYEVQPEGERLVSEISSVKAPTTLHIQPD